MPIPAHSIHHTYAEYLAFEASSNVKHEFLAGQIYAMAGGTPEHAAMAAAIIGLLFQALHGGRCRAYDAGLRVRTPTGLATYPDITVICGPRELDREDHQAVSNPTLIVEVLSRSTEEYDRGDKFEHYKSIRSLQQYVIGSYPEPHLEVWTRGHDDVWTPALAGEGDVAPVTAIGARLDVRELYEAAADPPAEH